MDVTDVAIWQCRIPHGVRYQRSAVLFPASVQIGLDFNAELERKEKLDLSLLTNAVMLELHNFAKSVSKSEAYFLFEVLEFNFDLGMDAGDHRRHYEFARRLHSKIKAVKDLIKTRPRSWKEAFLLPEPSALMASAWDQTGRFNRIRNTSVDCSMLSSERSRSAERETTVTKGPFVVKREGRLKRITYPFCRDLGVTLVVRPGDAPKEKLDRSLVTNGVMLELLDFAGVLCGTHVGIIRDLIKQNFGEEFDKFLFRLQLNELVEKKRVLSAEDRDALLKEAFQIQKKNPEQKRRKRKNPDAGHQEQEGLTMASKRRETLSFRDDDPEDVRQDLSYTCPVEFETETQSDLESGPKKEEEEDVFEPHTKVLDGRLRHFRRQNTPLESVSGLFSEDKHKDVNVKTHKQKLWTRRAARSQQILTSSRVTDLFARCREAGLDFNVGSGHKQNLDLQLFTNRVMSEVVKFATAMSKSLRHFLSDVMRNNFNVNELRERNLLFYMMTKEKVVSDRPDVGNTEFLSRPFHFPEGYNGADVTSDIQAGQEVETEPQTNGDSPAPAANQQVDTELHPFCAKLGLNLWSTGRPANQKLDLSTLTMGAALEIFNLVRELCGSVCETVNDILEHNFDLELQSGETDASRVIQKWYATQRSVMKGYAKSPRVIWWLNEVVLVNGDAPLRPQRAEAIARPEDLDSEDVKPQLEAFAGHEEPQEEKVHSYRICQEMGLSLSVVSKPEPEEKLELRLLTRGTLFEIHQYVKQNCNRYVPALYEILSYNFDLSSQDHRRVEFAWAVASQVIAIARKKGRTGDYLNTAVELPVESSQVVCKEEPEDVFGEPDPDDNDIVFVRELKPVDIEVIVE